MKKRYLEAAKITKTVGLKGEMRARILCDGTDVLTREEIFLGEDHEPVRIISAADLKNDMCKIKIARINTVEDAQKLVNKTLYIDRERMRLPENTWFIADLIGISVYDADSGVFYGKIDEIYTNSPRDVYSVKTPSGKQLLFPAIPEVLISADIDNDRMEIRPLKGLFEDQEVVGED